MLLGNNQSVGVLGRGRIFSAANALTSVDLANADFAIAVAGEAGTLANTGRTKLIELQQYVKATSVV